MKTMMLMVGGALLAIFSVCAEPAWGFGAVVGVIAFTCGSIRFGLEMSEGDAPLGHSYDYERES